MSAGEDPCECAYERLETVHDDVDAVASSLRERRPDDERVGERAVVFGALANDHRLVILSALREGELCVCELQYVLAAPQSTVATHLRTLREAGLVKTRKKGKWTYYRIADTATLQLLDLAEGLETTDPDR